jgi:hypothetical protein
MTTQLLEQQNSLFVPLTDFAITEAEEMARCHQNIAKRKDVFDKSVALAGLADWLGYDLGLVADMAMGDFYDPLLRDCRDVADLVVAETLKIECCIVEDGATDFTIAPDVYPEMDSSRVAYVVVRLPDDLVELEILGFLRVDHLSGIDLALAIPISELEDPEELQSCLAVEMRVLEYSEQFARLIAKDFLEKFYRKGQITDTTAEEMLMTSLAGIGARDAGLLKGQQESIGSAATVDLAKDEQELRQEAIKVLWSRLKQRWS